MGVAGSSEPLWVPPYESPTWDMWGHVPPGLKPSQYNVNDFYVNNAFPTLKSNDGGPLAGQQNSIMETFGMPVENLPQVANVYKEQGSGNWTTFGLNPVNQFSDWTQKGLGNGFWAPTPTTCNPLNYPACDLSDMRNYAPIVTPYVDWWATVSGGVIQTAAGFKINTDGPGAAVNVMDRWLTGIDANVQNYTNGGLSALSGVNTKDTSGYDPCTEKTIIEMLLPYVVGTALSYVYKTYLSDLLTMLPDESKNIIAVAVYGGGHAIGAAALDKIVGYGDPALFQIDMERAAFAISAGAGGAIGFALGTNIGGDAAPPIATVLTGALAVFLLQPPISVILQTSGTLLQIATLPLAAWIWFTRFWCYMSNWNQSACFDADTHPDARRWDVASLAARLTDMACEQEGWSRDSAQAKYVFQGLITNPSFMKAATVDGSDGMYALHHVDPAGVIAPIHEKGQSTLYYTSNGSDTKQKWNGEFYSFTGKDEGPFQVADHNRFACQNWDVLINADECNENPGTKDPRDPPSAPANPADTTDCAKDTDQQGNDKLLAANLKKWLKALVESSKNPNNLAAAQNIPGMVSVGYTPRTDNMPSVKKFFATCAKNYDGTTGLGFDYVAHRGQFATLYLSLNGSISTKLGTVEDVQMIVNSLFARATMDEAYKQLVESFSLQNQHAAIHYWFAKKGYLQQDDFDRWKSKNPAILDVLLEKNPGFEVWHGAITKTKPVTPLTPVYGIDHPLPFDPFTPTHEPPVYAAFHAAYNAVVNMMQSFTNMTEDEAEQLLSLYATFPPSVWTPNLGVVTTTGPLPDSVTLTSAYENAKVTVTQQDANDLVLILDKEMKNDYTQSEIAFACQVAFNYLEKWNAQGNISYGGLAMLTPANLEIFKSWDTDFEPSNPLPKPISTTWASSKLNPLPKLTPIEWGISKLFPQSPLTPLKWHDYHAPSVPTQSPASDAPFVQASRTIETTMGQQQNMTSTDYKQILTLFASFPDTVWNGDAIVNNGPVSPSVVLICAYENANNGALGGLDANVLIGTLSSTWGFTFYHADEIRFAEQVAYNMLNLWDSAGNIPDGGLAQLTPANKQLFDSWNTNFSPY